MKKIIMVSIGSALFLIISSIVAYFLKYINFESELPPFLYGVGILIISGVIALILIGKKTMLNIIPFIISGISLGFLINCWYIMCDYNNSLGWMIIVSILCVGYLWVFYLLLYIKFIEKHITLFLILYIVISIIVYVIVIILTENTYVSTFGFYMIIEIAFMFALCRQHEDRYDLVRSLTISTYSVFIVAIIILIIMISEGDFDFDLSGLDFNISSPKEKKKKNN